MFGWWTCLCWEAPARSNGDASWLVSPKAAATCPGMSYDLTGNKGG